MEMDNSSSKSGVPSSPLLMYKPFNLAVLLTMYSPLVVSLLIFSMSFIYQNFKGIIYLCWLILFSYIRSLFYSLKSANPKEAENKDKLCDALKYTMYGNSTFSMFFISFSMLYICMPMFLNNDINYWIFSAFLFYLFLDIGIRKSLGCVKMPGVFMNIVAGGSLGVIAVFIMAALQLQNYLFFNEISSTKEVCNMPSKQTFKCAVYKNGELVGSTTTN